MKRLVLTLLALGSAVWFTGCAGTRTAMGGRYDAVAYKPHNPNNVRVKVSLQNRAVYVMEGDRPLLVTATAIGKPGNVTPTGSSHVTRKEATKRSYTYGFWVNANQIVPGKSDHSPGGGGW